MAEATLPILDPEWAGCCSPVVGEPLDQARAEVLAAAFKAVAEPTRLRLLSLVAAHADGEACICELTEPVGLSQPTVSHHMKVLVDAGLLTREQRGKWAYYQLIPGAMESLAQTLALAVPARATVSAGPERTATQEQDHPSTSGPSRQRNDTQWRTNAARRLPAKPSNRHKPISN